MSNTCHSLALLKEKIVPISSIALSVLLMPSIAIAASEDDSVEVQDAIVLALTEIKAVEEHSSQALRREINDEFDKSRTTSYIDGSLLQKLNPVNISDPLRYSAPGLINSPWGGNRFGGSTKIRTLGDWGAATSIDGLPAFRTAGQEGGGYTGTLIPAIAVESMSVHKGSQGVQYGDGTDGGTIVTKLKSGQNYKNHLAVNIDYSTADEVQLQAEVANGTKQGDYYIAARWLEGSYSGEPANMDSQNVKGLVAKFGWNFSEKTRLETFFIKDHSQPTIFRRGELNKIDTDAAIVSITLDHSFNDSLSMQGGYFYSDTRSQWPDRNRDRSVTDSILFVNAYLAKDLSSAVRWTGTLGIENLVVDTYRDTIWHNTFDDVSIKTANSFVIDNNLALNLGMRYTQFDNKIILNEITQPDNLKTDDLLSYELGASYSVSDHVRIRSVLATGYNRFFSKYGNFGEDVLDPTGAEDEVVESTNYEIAMNIKWADSYLDIALYQINQDGVPRRNDGKLESMEVDQSAIEVEYYSAFTDKLSLSAGYMRIIDVEATRADGTKSNGNIFWGGQVVPVPKDQFSVRLNYNLNSALSLWSAAFYNSGFNATAADDSVVERRAYERIDLGAQWRISNALTTRVRIENITDEKDFGATIEGKEVNDEGKLGRVAWLGLDYVF